VSKIADNLAESKTAKYDDLKMSFDKMVAECNKMKSQIEALQKEVAFLRRVAGQENVQKGEEKQHEKRPTPHLLLADSILRDVDPKKLIDTTFYSLPGARISTLKERLQNYHGSSYDSVTFHVATNDLDNIKDEPEKIPDVIEEYKALIEDSKAITNSVIVSSICPRLDDASALVEPFNAALRVVCDESNVKFVDHTPSFTLGDGVVNDGYIWRNGPHLTRPGVNRIAKNLKVSVRPGESDITRSTYRPNHSGDRHTRIDYQNRGSEDIQINRDGCRRCNERGHNEEQCRHFRPVKCNTCHLRGHKSKHHRKT
jgi:hypothetical protein